MLFCWWQTPAYLFAAADSSRKPASDSGTVKDTHHWVQTIEPEWGGYLKLRGSISRIEPDSIFAPVGTGTFCDGGAEIRVENRLIFSKQAYWETHYEAVFITGDTLEKGNTLKLWFPEIFGEDDLLLVQTVNDKRRFLDLTATLAEGDDSLLYHRLDRLNLTLEPGWGVMRIGRQAVTWGNGLLFNPMDLFNPFSPIDIESEQKIGDDMIFMNVPWEKAGDFQGLMLPRRDPSGEDVDWESSSLAGKFHVLMGDAGFDIMAAHHYADDVVGIGMAHSVGPAGLRLDATWTFLDPESHNDDYLSLVADVEFGWTLWNRNFYGLIEFYHMGLGKDDPSEAIADADILKRLARGELYTLGKNYLSGLVQVELYPWLNAFITVVHNLGDSSGILQPWVTWNVTQDFRATMGGNVSYGGDGTEFGGFRPQGSPAVITLADSLFLYLTYFF